MNFKGGQGKSHIALNLSMTFDLGIVVNEPTSALKHVLEEDEILLLDHKDKIPSEISDCIFDLGGFISPLMDEAIKKSDFVIVPVKEDPASALTSIDTLLNLKNYSKNIICIINMQKNFIESKNFLIDKGCDFVEYFPLRTSAAIENIFVDKKTINEQYNKGGRFAFSFKKVNNEMENIIKHIVDNYNYTRIR